MSNDLPPSMSDPGVLAALPVAQLIELILRQQQVIERLQHNGSSVAANRTLSNGVAPTDATLTQESNTRLSHPHLVIHAGAGAYHFPLVDGSCWTIGRGPENSIVLSDQWMSRNHAMVQSTGMSDYYLIDLGSRNGSFVNERRVSVPLCLQHGDVLTFGETKLEFHAPTSFEAIETPDSTLNLPFDPAPATHLLHVRRLITVLVVDIRSFTVLTRKLDERLLSEVVGTWFGNAGKIIRDSGSWVDKYIGDAVMAVWTHGTQDVGWEQIQQPLQAVKALHEMTSQLHLAYPLPFPLKIGAGINTGYAMVGNTGSGDRPDYTALGDTVNAGFRLETSTKQLGLDIALGPATYQYLLALGGDPLPFQQYAVHWKGYDAPTRVYACTFEALDRFLNQR